MEYQELPEPLRSLQKDHDRLKESESEVRQEIEGLLKRSHQISSEIRSLIPAINLYRQRQGLTPLSSEGPLHSEHMVAPITEDALIAEKGAGESGKESFASYTNSERDEIVQRYIEEAERFRQMGEMVEDLQEQYDDVSRHHTRKVIERLFDDGDLVSVRYGTSLRYTAYGLKQFIRLTPEGEAQYADPRYWPDMHSSMNEPFSFEWKGDPPPPIENTTEPENEVTSETTGSGPEPAYAGHPTLSGFMTNG